MHAETKSPSGAGYWQEATRPLTCLVFVTPIILIYEVGVLWLATAEPNGVEVGRNGVDVLLRWCLQSLGFGQYFLLPLLVAGILLAWHHTTGERWRLRGSTLMGMLLESAGFGLLLLLLAPFLGSLISTTDVSIHCATGENGHGLVIRFFGAGIYEELLFRLMMLPSIAFFVRKCGVSRGWSLVVSMLVTSLIFSAAHYQPFNTFGETFDWTTFFFRFSAGIYFSALFLVRGFGVAVGAHALYDVFASFI